jgi:hypothetical protein
LSLLQRAGLLSLLVFSLGNCEKKSSSGSGDNSNEGPGKPKPGVGCKGSNENGTSLNANIKLDNAIALGVIEMPKGTKIATDGSKSCENLKLRLAADKDAASQVLVKLDAEGAPTVLPLFGDGNAEARHVLNLGTYGNLIILDFDQKSNRNFNIVLASPKGELFALKDWGVNAWEEELTAAKVDEALGVVYLFASKIFKDFDPNIKSVVRINLKDQTAEELFEGDKSEFLSSLQIVPGKGYTYEL